VLRESTFRGLVVTWEVSLVDCLTVCVEGQEVFSCYQFSRCSRQEKANNAPRFVR